MLTKTPQNRTPIHVEDTNFKSQQKTSKTEHLLHVEDTNFRNFGSCFLGVRIHFSYNFQDFQRLQKLS